MSKNLEFSQNSFEKSEKITFLVQNVMNHYALYYIITMLHYIAPPRSQILRINQFIYYGESNKMLKFAVNKFYS